MTRFVRLALALVACTAPVATSAQATRADTPIVPEVRTSAVGERSVLPDLATVTLRFSATGRTPLDAGRAVAARADSLRRALQAIGIPRDSLVTGSRWYWWRGRMEQVVGQLRHTSTQDAAGRIIQIPVQDTTYRAHDAIEVRIRDMRKVGAVIDSAFAHGILEIPGIRFTATDFAAAHDAAAREATELAREQANAIAQASGGRLGRTLWLSTSADYGEGGASRGMTMESAGMRGQSTEVIASSIPIRVTVHGRWELLEKP